MTDARRLSRVLGIGLVVLAMGAGVHALAQAAGPAAVKVVVVGTFEIGALAGDAPGELQLWVEREGLEQELPFAGDRRLRLSRDGSVLGVVSGTSPTDASASMMALALDPRFDVSHAYWIVNGIAGVDPEDASLGSVAWAHFVVDGDQVHELDARDAPASWPYGRFALGTKVPGQRPANPGALVYELNRGLVDWAFGLTKGVTLDDAAVLREGRARYRTYPKAAAPPVVIEGDDLGSATFWHGSVMNRWANDWVSLTTGGRGNFVMTNMEDHGIAAALRRLSVMGRVSFDRVLFLRAASNYSMQAPGDTAEQSLNRPPAATAALESAHRVGAVVLRELLRNWSTLGEHPPGR